MTFCIINFSLSAGFDSIWSLDWTNLLSNKLREHGSGNTGTTNTFRILGKKAGMATFVIDFFKGTLASPSYFFHQQGVSPLSLISLAVIGHTFPIFAGFKGARLSPPVLE